MQYNRIKFNATLDASGRIVVGSAVTGYRVPPVSLWVHTGQTLYVEGHHNYLLENAAGDWELGCMHVASDGTTTRDAIEYSGSGFAPSATGLTCSMVASVNNAVATGAFYGAGSEPRASYNSIAIGPYAEATIGMYEGLAIGNGAWAIADKAIAIGAGMIALKPNETVVGGADSGCQRQIIVQWEGESSADNGPFRHSGGDAMDFGDYDAILATRKPGIIRVRGTVVAWFTATDQTSAVSKVYDVDYLVFIDPTAGTATSIGTPAFTSKFAGGSSPNITLSVQASTGAMYMSTTATAMFYARAVLQLDDFQTSIMPSATGARGL